MNPLNPVMAVLVIASLGASPLRALTDDGDNAGVPAAAAEDKNPVNALARILAENPAARADAGKRVAEFLLAADDGKSFVAADVDAEALGAVAREWCESKGGNVAALYFVAGPGPAVPDWALKDPVLSRTFKSGMQWEGRLRAALADWTGESQIDKAKEKAQAAAFLNDAAAKAAAVFSDPRTKKELDLSIAGNDTTAPVVPDTSRSPGARLDGASRRYTLDDLYKDGAVVVDVYGPKDEHSRRISMKIYTRRVDGELVNEIGIFDVTDTNDIFGQRFPIDSGKQSFALDDRTPGKKKYELSFGKADEAGNRTITLARPGDGGAPLKTSVSDLFLKRADQAAGMGNIVTIGGEDFYTLPQGGAKGALALFAKELIDGRGTSDARDLAPSLYAEVGRRGPDGRNQNMPPGEKGGPHLGTVGDKEYHLEFNKELGAWEVKDGPGDLPKPDAKPAAGGAGASASGGSDSGGPSSESGRSAGEVLLKFKEDIASGKCRNPDETGDLTKDLAKELEGQYAIITCKDDRKGLIHNVIIPTHPDIDGREMRYTSIPELKLKLLRVRFFDHYVILEFDKEVQYLDLLKVDKDAEGNPNFSVSGYIKDGKDGKMALNFIDSLAFVDALKRYMGVKGKDAGAFTAVPKRVAEQLGNKPYYLFGGFPKDALKVTVKADDETFIVWPTVTKPGAAPDAAPGPYASLSGPANAMEGDVSSENKPFEPEFEVDKRVAKLIGTLASAEAKNIALYETTDPIEKDTEKKHYVLFRYRTPDPKELKIIRHRPLEVFGKDNPYPGDGLQMQGLVEGTVVKDRGAAGYTFIPGSTKEKGALVMLQNKQVSAENAKKGADNCVGPLIWWGLAGRDEALKACREGKF